MVPRKIGVSRANNEEAAMTAKPATPAEYQLNVENGLLGIPNAQAKNAIVAAIISHTGQVFGAMEIGFPAVFTRPQ